MTEIDDHIRTDAGRAALEMRQLSQATSWFRDPDTALVVLMNLRIVLEQAAQTIEHLIEVHDQHAGQARGYDMTPTTGEKHARTAWAALVAATSLARGARDQVAIATAEIGQVAWPDWRRAASEPPRPEFGTDRAHVVEEDLDLDYGDDGLGVDR
jgi:hypothetical protein